MVVDEVFLNMEVGEVYGLYLDGNFYKVVKLRDKVVMVDFVDFWYILFLVIMLVFFDEVEKRIDSLKLVLESGVVFFDFLVLKFS